VKHKTQMLLGGAAIVGLAIAGYVYVGQQKTAAAVPSNPQLSPGVPVATLTPGQKYAVGATTPTGVSDQQTLTQQIAAAGWSNVTILYFAGNGQIPQGMPAPAANGYVYTGTWNGAPNAPIPPGVLAVTA
jgi:hypothetical protein